MAEKKKRITAQMPRVPASNYDTRIGITKLDDIYGGNPTIGQRGDVDPLEEYERLERLDTVQQLQELRRRKREVEASKKLKKIQQELEQEEQTQDGGLNVEGMFRFSPQELQQISQMPQDERAAFLATVREIALMSSTMPSGGGKNQMNPMFQLMAMGGFGGRAQQGLNVDDVVKIQRMFQDAGPGRDDSRNLVMKLITETLPAYQNVAVQNMQMAYQAQISALEKQRSDPLNEIKFVKDLAAELGMRPSDAGSVSEAVALKTLDMQNMWKLKEFEMRQQEISQSRTLGIVEQIMKQVNLPNLLKLRAREETRSAIQGPPIIREESVLPQYNTMDAQLHEAPRPNTRATMKAGMDGAIQGPGGPVPNLLEYECPKCRNRIVAAEDQVEVTCLNCGGRFLSGGPKK